MATMPSLGIADPPAIAVHSPSRQLQTGKQIKYVPQAADAWINRITWCFIQDYSILKWFPTGSYDLSCLSRWFQEMSLLMNWYTSHPSYVNIILLVLWTRKGAFSTPEQLHWSKAKGQMRMFDVISQAEMFAMQYGDTVAVSCSRLIKPGKGEL